MKNTKVKRQTRFITELIFDYCRLFSEDFFTGKRQKICPLARVNYTKYVTRAKSGEIQIGEFIDGKLTGEGKIIKNSIIEKKVLLKWRIKWQRNHH